MLFIMLQTVYADCTQRMIQCKS